HHGSKTSSSAAFLAAVAPRLAFGQAAYLSRYGHPAPPVLARYQAQGIPVWMSADCGALRWRSGDAEPTCERQAAHRYWFREPLPVAGFTGPVELDSADQE
ncbi:MAG: hypothetical protein JOY60_08935, partial [Burkholderiaceae bacterium]|nr:hypothetical protein [Burkholderiaceae bacterium]